MAVAYLTDALRLPPNRLRTVNALQQKRGGLETARRLRDRNVSVQPVITEKLQQPHTVRPKVSQ